MLNFQRLERRENAPPAAREMLVDNSADDTELDVDNRRRARRINRKISVRYRLAGESVESSFALNVSATGARVVLKGARPSFRNEITLELGNQVDLVAHTVWEEPLPGGHCRVAGVVFETMMQSQRDALHRLLNALDDSKSSRPKFTLKSPR